MPKFLEDELSKEYGNNPHAKYGILNKIGVVKGNKETVNYRELEAKYSAVLVVGKIWASALRRLKKLE
jgi:hypothetical protein